MRLDVLLGLVGKSRREMKYLIKTGQVTIDGQRAASYHLNVDTGLQEIRVEQDLLRIGQETYFILNKPKGVVSACQDKEHQTVVDLLAPVDRKDRIYPVGRLDRDTEGLLLLTTNGPLGYQLLHPSYHVTKTYEVVVNGPLLADANDFFAQGVVFLDGKTCQPAQLEIIETGDEQSKARITIVEGKFHQVKKMFLAYGVKVTYLKRISFGPFHLDDALPVGHYRALTRQEIEWIKTYLG
ncbi:pseudouridine synthase [Streptococcus sp. sy004]|uniref:pseudouridine synthase n=1 Tax=Streptococcus sp. sy004 TaxID=2600149 RepID=UPI0011B5417D|nr:16S rRNA pseudouridine(516) synthase [Streptococcus sp. sy004]TWT12412.1 16S rRNA pseudouridine(516) synthase [Streptococcus sp. sy004]